MYRKLKTHVVYNKDNVVIRPATLHEEYEIGNWIKSYPWIKIGFVNQKVNKKY